jgi:hypothetical protein
MLIQHGASALQHPNISAWRMPLDLAVPPLLGIKTWLHSEIKQNPKFVLGMP